MALTTLASGAIGALLPGLAVSASAAISGSGQVCWPSHGAFTYPREARVAVHGGQLALGSRERLRFREQEGRGYWRGDRRTEW